MENLSGGANLTGRMWVAMMQQAAKLELPMAAEPSKVPMTVDPKTARAALRAQPAGSEIRAAFLVQSCDRRLTRRGKPYLALVFADVAGPIEGRLWDAEPADEAVFVTGEPVELVANIDVYQSRPQLVIQTAQPVADRAALPWDELVSGPRVDPQKLTARLKQILGSIRDPHLAALRNRYFADADFIERFTTWPAAAKYHHAWTHGLLEHTVSALELAGRICQQYPHLNRDLVVMGVFLHDSGKIYEFEATPGGGASYTEYGKLVGHITIGVSMLERKLAAVKDFPPALANHLRHLIVAHHGQLEFGSPKMPMTPEALVVHHVECLDSELATFQQEGEAVVRAAPDAGTNGHLPGDSGAGAAAPVFVFSSRFRREIMVTPPSSESGASTETGTRAASDEGGESAANA